jgi:hypothetical protein
MFDSAVVLAVALILSGCSGSTGSGDNNNDNVADGSFRLDGVWDDAGRQVVLVQAGTEITGTHVEQFVCDLDGGPVPPGEAPPDGAETQATFLYFRGDLDGQEAVLPTDTVVGEITICRFGLPSGADPGSGLQTTPITFTVVDAFHLTGSWQMDDNNDGTPEASGSITLIRQVDDE